MIEAEGSFTVLGPGHPVGVRCLENIEWGGKTGHIRGRGHLLPDFPRGKGALLVISSAPFWYFTEVHTFWKAALIEGRRWDHRGMVSLRPETPSR